MIKNRTLEFKSKYSTSQAKKPRDTTPQHIKTKLATTGFTTITETSTLNKKTTRKIAKVQSTAFFKSRTKLIDAVDEPQTISKNLIENETSLCRYLHNKKIPLENPFPHRYRMNLDQSEISQKTANHREEHTTNEVKKTCIIIKQLPNIDLFFNNLTPRSLFFCCKCFRYVFAIQKNLHHPKCENEVNLIQLESKEKQRICWEKLNMILELSQYTSFKHTQISELFQSVKNNKLQQVYDVRVSPNVSYLSFQEIVEAFIFTKEMLLAGDAYNSSGIFSMKKILACVEPKKFSSTLFERKFFQ